MRVSTDYGLTADFLRSLYELDFEGNLRHKSRTPSMFADGLLSAEHKCNVWNTKYAGKEVCPSPTRYKETSIQILNGKKLQLQVHNIIWCIVHGEWPTKIVDHINLNKTDNSIDNLRLATITQQNMNKPIQSNNTSGVPGVCWIEARQMWRATIMVKGKAIRLYYGDNFEDAIAARKQAEREYFGEYARM